MKTLADLKRKLTPGAKVKLILRFGNKMDVIKTVSKIQTTGIYFQAEGQPKPSWLGLPTASLLEITDTGFSVFLPGYRPLTPKEKAILENAPSRRPENAKQCEIEALSDGSSLFWQDKKYYADQKFPYYNTIAGEKYAYKKGIQTNKIKGEKSLEYIII